jgi:glycosyltransferase involved in cell wall biosynthesis
LRLSRLLIVSRSHNPLGGADRIIADLCRELPARGWDTVLGLTRGARFDDPDAYRQVHQDLPTVEIDGTFGTRGCRLKALQSTIRRVAPDVVLSMRVFDTYEAVARLKTSGPAKAPRLMVGVRVFESPYIHDVRQWSRNIDFCVTSGQLVAAACRQLGQMESERVESIPGGVAGPMPPVEPRQTLNPVRLLYAGRLEQSQKRVLDLVEFVQELVKRNVTFELDVCGAGPEESQLRRSLAAEADKGIVLFHGWVSQQQLYERFYPRADCFVHFAAWEGVTISPREAMAHGVIPVISEFTGLRTEGQFIHEVNSLLFPVGCPQKAADCVARLVADRALSHRLSLSAMQSQTGRYSHEGALDAWRDALIRCRELPAKTGFIPTVPENLDGRLTRWGVPAQLQLTVRNLLGWPAVQHFEPGSEWPTSSGTLTAEMRDKIERFAAEFEKKSGGNS